MNKRIRPILLASLAAFSIAGVAACGDDTEKSAVDIAAEKAEEQIKNPPEVADVEEPTLKVVKVEAERRRGGHQQEAEDPRADR